MYAAVSVYIYTVYPRKTELTENGNFRLFAENKKRKFVFLGRQTIHGKQRVLCQQTCPSMIKKRYGVLEIWG
jgi:hypothetical protein